MVMGETQPHVSRLGRLRKAPESGQSGPTIDLCEFLGSSLSLEQSTNISDSIYRHGAPEYPDISHIGPDWPLSGAYDSVADGMSEETGRFRLESLGSAPGAKIHAFWRP